MSFKCDFCEKEFSSAGELGGHRSGHVRRGELSKAVKSFFCEVCNKELADGYELNSHKIAHTRTIEDVTDFRTKKRYLLLELGHKCQVCENTEWMGKPIPIEIDHIDGNPENNERANLRLICPNCHAQTDTYKGRNIGKVENSKRKQTLKKYYGQYR